MKTKNFVAILIIGFIIFIPNECFSQDDIKHNSREYSSRRNESNIEIMIVEVNFESVDSIVISQLDAVQSDIYDPKLLMEIYRNL